MRMVLSLFLFLLSPVGFAHTLTNGTQVFIDQKIFPTSVWKKKAQGPDAFILKETGSNDSNKTVIRFYPENEIPAQEFENFPNTFDGYRDSKRKFLSKYKGEIIEFVEPQRSPMNGFDHYVYGVEFILSGERFLEINAIGKCGEQLLAFKGLALKKNADDFKSQMKSLLKGVKCD